MINASIRFTVAAEARDKLRDVLLSVLGPTKAKSGCISCRLYQEIGNPGNLMLLEQWETDEQLTRHIISSGYHRVLEAMELAEQQPEVKFDKVASTQGFSFIETIRS